MKILVTGGAGFIGSHFVEWTLANRPGQQITVLDSLSYAGSLDNLESSLSRITFRRGDIRDSDLVDKLVSEADLVVHFAAESHNDRSLANPKLFFDVNLTGTLVLLDSVRRHEVRFHHVSTDEVFGDLPLDSLEKFSESSPYRPSSPYAASKAASDHAVRAWVRSYGIRATISNCSNNYGLRQHPEKLIPTAIGNLLSGSPVPLYGSGTNIRDWIHVEDHVSGIWAVLQDGKIGETYLLGANCELSNIQIVQKLAEILDFRGNPYILTDDRPGHDQRYALDARRSTRELNWMPRHDDIDSGLKDVVGSYLLAWRSPA